MMSQKQKEKEETDPGMPYTYMVLEAIRNQGGQPASSEGADWEEQKKKQWDSNVSRISADGASAALIRRGSGGVGRENHSL